MVESLEKAIQLILTADKELCNILLVTAKTSISSSVLALLLGVPLGILLGIGQFRGRHALLVINRTLMGMPPVVCGLVFYMLFSGVGPLRHMSLLFTVEIMILAVRQGSPACRAARGTKNSRSVMQTSGLNSSIMRSTERV